MRSQIAGSQPVETIHSVKVMEIRWRVDHESGAALLHFAPHVPDIRSELVRRTTIL
jgi:hypothetical protein